MKVLTTSEEIKLIQRLIEYPSAPNCGSSRAVVDLPNHVQKELFAEWGIKVNPLASYIVKIAIGVGGYVQAMNEISVYKNYGHTGYLAAIVAYGQYCEIMEKVTIYYDDEKLKGFEPICNGSLYDSPYMWLTRRDSRTKFWTTLSENGATSLNYADWLNEIEDDGEALVLYVHKYWEIYPQKEEEDKIYMNEVGKATEVICSLNEMLGDSDDNSQIGRNADDKLVCYDYGYRKELWGDSYTWSSPACEYLSDDEDKFTEYLEYLKRILQEATQFESLLSKNPKGVLNRRLYEIDWLEQQGYEDDAESLRFNTRQNVMFKDCEGVSEV